jgi:hypothetical protein
MIKASSLTSLQTVVATHYIVLCRLSRAASHPGLSCSARVDTCGFPGSNRFRWYVIGGGYKTLNGIGNKLSD